MTVRCAGCGALRERSNVLLIEGKAEHFYVCRPTVYSGNCFRNRVCWVGHHRIAP